MPRLTYVRFGYNLIGPNGKVGISSPGNFGTREEAQSHLDAMLRNGEQLGRGYTGEVTQGEYKEYDEEWAARILKMVVRLDAEEQVPFTFDDVVSEAKEYLKCSIYE